MINAELLSDIHIQISYHFAVLSVLDGERRHCVFSLFFTLLLTFIFIAYFIHQVDNYRLAFYFIFVFKK